jgi:8-oxo-dGTP pyrophosphatase MutT (NUDIX family)
MCDQRLNGRVPCERALATPAAAERLTRHVHDRDGEKHADHRAPAALCSERQHERNLNAGQPAGGCRRQPARRRPASREAVESVDTQLVEPKQGRRERVPAPNGACHAAQDRLARSMPAHPPVQPGITFRHFTVAVFVVHAGRVLLHYHRKLGKWLPPGGHIEDDELPDQAALREVLEETGIRVRLIGPRGLPIESPLQLVVPAGIQVETIYLGHQHIDLVYFARPEPDDLAAAEIDARLAASDRVGWYAEGELEALGVDDEIRAWCRRVLDTLAGTC